MNVSTVTIVTPSATEIVLGTLTYPSGHGYGYTLDEAQLSPAPRDLTALNLPLVPGGLVTPGELSYREISLSGMVVADTAAAVRVLYGQLVAATSIDGAGLLRVRYHNGTEDVEAYGVLSGSVEGSAAGGPYMNYSLTILCGDPVSYSMVPSIVVAASGAGAVTLPNAGSASVYPTLTITGSATSVTVASSNGQTLVLGWAGHYLPGSGTTIVVCKPGEEVVTVSGGVNYSVLAVGSALQMRIPPGGVSFTVTASGGTASVSCAYREGYLA